MPITAAPPHAHTVQHLGRIDLDQPGITTGFDVHLRRTAPPGTPLTPQDRSWPGQMRRIGQVHLRIWGLDALIEAVDLLLSELVTNGFQHGEGDTVRVRLWRSATYVGIEVAGDSGAQGAREKVAGAEDERGRGLQLVGVVADAWGVAGDGARTWCLLAINGGGA
ncbi:ATP-binding protein [Streptomyces sp. NPDC055078]